VVKPVLVTAGVAARIPKPQAVPNPEGGGTAHEAEVVKLHEKFTAR